VDRHQWDERYASRELVWSAEPNVFVAEVAGPLPPGRALDVACGEGRNAIWLATRGWRVTAIDFSAVAIGKARRLAEAAGVAVDWLCDDVLAWQPLPENFELVLLSYLQLPAGDMAAVVGRAATALVPGGALLLVGHARANLAGGVGGPQDPSVLYEPGEAAAWAGQLEVARAEHVYRSVDTPEGPRRAIDTLVVAVRR